MQGGKTNRHARTSCHNGLFLELFNQFITRTPHISLKFILLYSGFFAFLQPRGEEEKNEVYGNLYFYIISIRCYRCWYMVCERLF